jgi:hypothetical protein
MSGLGLRQVSKSHELCRPCHRRLSYSPTSSDPGAPARPQRPAADAQPKRFCRPLPTDCGCHRGAAGQVVCGRWGGHRLRRRRPGRVRPHPLQPTCTRAFDSSRSRHIGIVEAVGSAVKDVAVGDEVIGFTHNRSSHAELVVIEADNLITRPTHVSWEQAGALFVAGTTA